jgi:hypothetical protein
MNQFVEVLTAIGFAVVAWILFSLRPLTRGLTVRSAWYWAMAAVVANLAVVLLRLLNPEAALNVESALLYLAAVLLLTPFVDVLGARNPGHRAWPWFVVLPMVIVLQWPALSQLWSQRTELPVEIPSPTAIGFLFVLVMGGGNYFGTANTLATTLASAAVTCVLLPLTEWVDWPGPGFHLAAAVLLMFAGLLVRIRFTTPGQETAAGQAVWGDVEADGEPATAGGAESGESLSSEVVAAIWMDFRDLFGTVWAKRVMDRMNQFGAREKWTVILTLDGFRNSDSAAGSGSTAGSDRVPASGSTAGSEPTDEELIRPFEVLKWLLRRFASAEFFARYGTGLEAVHEPGEESSPGG